MAARPMAGARMHAAVDARDVQVGMINHDESRATRVVSHKGLRNTDYTPYRARMEESKAHIQIHEDCRGATAKSKSWGIVDTDKRVMFSRSNCLEPRHQDLFPVRSCPYTFFAIRRERFNTFCFCTPTGRASLSFAVASLALPWRGVYTKTYSLMAGPFIPPLKVWSVRVRVTRKAEPATGDEMSFSRLSVSRVCVIPNWPIY
jgi:hypothetical protein